MALERRNTYGSTLSVDPAGGSSFTVIASIVDGWEGPGIETEESDVSILGDAFNQYIAGRSDPGELSYQIAYDPNDTNSQTLVDLAYSKATATWKATLSSLLKSSPFKNILTASRFDSGGSSDGVGTQKGRTAGGVGGDDRFAEVAGPCLLRQAQRIAA